MDGVMNDNKQEAVEVIAKRLNRQVSHSLSHRDCPSCKDAIAQAIQAERKVADDLRAEVERLTKELKERRYDVVAIGAAHEIGLVHPDEIQTMQRHEIKRLEAEIAKLKSELEVRQAYHVDAQELVLLKQENERLKGAKHICLFHGEDACPACAKELHVLESRNETLSSQLKLAVNALEQIARGDVPSHLKGVGFGWAIEKARVALFVINQPQGDK